MQMEVIDQEMPWLWDIKCVSLTNFPSVLTSTKNCTSGPLCLCSYTTYGSEYNPHQMCKDLHNDSGGILQWWNSSCFDWLPWSLQPPNSLDHQEVWSEGELLRCQTFNWLSSEAYSPWHTYSLLTSVKSDCSWCFRPAAQVLPGGLCGYNQAGT
jgi:hypothetical protein